VFVDLPHGLSADQLVLALNTETARQNGDVFQVDDGSPAHILSNRAASQGPVWSVQEIAEGEEPPVEEHSCCTPMTPEQRLMSEMQSLTTRANDLLNNGKLREARRLLSTAALLHRLAGSPKDDGYVWLCSMMAGAQFALGHSRAGARHDAIAIKLSTRINGDDHPSTVVLRNNYAENLVGAGEYATAEPLLRAGIAKLNEHIDDGKFDKDWLISARDDAAKNLAKLLAATGRGELADEVGD
jgi:hypothetical protein